MGHVYNITRVLLPFNFSNLSLNTLKIAIEICKRHNASLTVIHVVPNRHPALTAASGIVANMNPARTVAEMKVRIDGLTKEIRANHDLSVTGIVTAGNPAESICRWAAEWRSNLIVMGMGAGEKFLKVLFGSVTEEVVRKASCPVLTVPAGATHTVFKKILFPVREGIDAVDKYLHARPFVRLCHAWVLVDGITSSYGYSAFSKLNESIDKVIDVASNDAVNCTNNVKHTSDLAAEVLHSADLKKPDLIVITATNDRSIRRFAMKAYTARIINRSEVPVLCVQPAALASRFG